MYLPKCIHYCKHSKCTFLGRQEKYQKKATQGDIPKRHVPLRNPCARIASRCPKMFRFLGTYISNIASLLVVDARKSEHFRVSDGEAAGGFLRRALFRSASLSRFLWLLSCSVQESNITAPYALRKGIPFCSGLGRKNTRKANLPGGNRI